MQLTPKTNPHKLKQIRYITSQKESQTTPTKTKRQKNNQCNNCCIVEKKEQIKDLVVQTSNALQSRFSAYHSSYNSTCGIGDSLRNSLVLANIMFGMIHVGYSFAYSHPVLLIPIIVNIATIKSLQSEADLMNSVKQSQLATDLISYLNALNDEGISYNQRLLGRQRDIECQIKDHKEINIQTFSSFDLKAALNDYNTKLATLEQTKNIVSNEILEPILPIFNQYKNVDIEKCLTYIDALTKIDTFKNNLCASGWAIGTMGTAFALVSGGAPSPLLTLLSLITGCFTREDVRRKMPIVVGYLKTYKDHLGTTQNSVSAKTLKNKKISSNAE